jgi:hypothetical protein
MRIMCGRYPRPHRLHRQKPVRAGRVADGRGLGGVQREGLLDQDVLAVLEREDRVLGVEGVGGGDVEDVDLGVRHERFVGGVRVRDAELGGERP